MNDNQLMVGVGCLAAIVSYIVYSGPGPNYNQAVRAPASVSAPRARPRMLRDVQACTMDAQRDAVTGTLVSGSCTVLRVGEEIEIQYLFGGPDARAGDPDLVPCVRPVSWPREPGVYNSRESKDCVAVSRNDFQEAR